MNKSNSEKTSATNWERIDNMTDNDIDTSDIPPLDDNFFANATLRMPKKKTEESSYLNNEKIKH